MCKIKMLLNMVYLLIITGCETGSFSPYGTEWEYMYNEIEPNNNYYGAQSIDITETIYGDIGHDGDDSDWFTFIFPSNGIVQITIENHHSVNVSNGSMGPTHFYSGANLISLERWGSSFGDVTAPESDAQSARISVSAEHEYIVEITAKIDNVAPYSLEINFIKELTLDFDESNDNKYEASQYAFGLQATIGYFMDDNHVDEDDYYEFIPPRNGVLSFYIKNNQDDDVSYGSMGPTYLLDENLSQLSRWGSSFGDVTIPGRSSYSSNISVSSGEIYYIVITNKSKHSAPYELKGYWAD